MRWWCVAWTGLGNYAGALVPASSLAVIVQWVQRFAVLVAGLDLVWDGRSRLQVKGRA
jgi:hypothetical protein